MTDADRKFVREIRARINPAYAGVAGTESYERTRLLTLLYEAEAMREKAEFFCFKFLHPKRVRFDKRNSYEDADWIEAVRKEIEE